MRFLGAIIDSLCDFFSPDKAAGLAARLMKQSTAKRMYAVCKMAARILLILCVLALTLNMASCGMDTYKGYQLIEKAVTLKISRFNDWGAYALTITFGIVIAAFAVLCVKKYPFRSVCWMTGLNALLALAAVAFYKLDGKYACWIWSLSTGDVVLEQGTYLLTGLYLLSLCMSVYGRACEKALGFGMQYRDYQYRQDSIAKPTAVAACLLLTVLSARTLIEINGGDTEVLTAMLKILLVFAIVLLIMTVCRSEYAGVMAWVSLADCLAWCLIYYEESTLRGWLPLAVILVYLALSIYLTVLLNRRAASISVQPEPFSDGGEEKQEKNEELFCAECGMHLEQEDSFCPGCGKKR